MKLMIIDGNSIVNRAFFGVRPLSAKDGLPTNAIFGFLNIYQKLMNDSKPDAVCVTFDRKEPTFRHKMYDGYKAQRKGMPDELAQQMPVLKDVLDAMNVRRYECAGFEADDIIGTAARICEESGWDCEIVTGDKDSFQLITPHTTVRHVKSRMGQTETTLYDVDTFVSEYGFTPEKMVDLKSLMGDNSDNIPGVPGVGEKTALELVRTFGTLDGLYERYADDNTVKNGVKKKLEEGETSARMSYDLALISREAPVEFSPSDNMVKPADNDRLYELFKRLDFTKLTEKFGLTPPKEAAPSAERKLREEHDITDEKALSEMLKAFSGRKCAVYVLNANDTLAVTDGEKVYTADRYSYSGEWNDVLDAVFSSDLELTGHNIKDLIRELKKTGITADSLTGDTAIGAYLLDPASNSYEIERLSELFCGYEIDDGDGGQMTLLGGDDGKKAMIRACAVFDVCGVIEEKLRERGLYDLYENIELPLCRVLADMELTGVVCDKNALSEFSNQLSGGIDLLAEQIYALAGGEFNINSPKQLGTVLFENLGLPAPKKTKSGWSTNADVLEKLRNKHPIIDLITEYRQLSKLKSTYAEGLFKVAGEDGRIHTNFQMTVTATGRLSSVEPNLQNIPVRTQLGGEIRKMFSAPEGCVLVSADYSQIELRLLAHISGDENMRSAFVNGEDFHTVTASKVFGVSPEDVTPTQRSRAKAVNFGIVYGMSAFSLSQDIKVSVAEAKSYMDNYFEQYGKVRGYMEDIVETAKKNGFVTTLYGRRRDIPELNSSNFNIRSFGERVALNMPIQGTAADIMKIAMINVYNRLKNEGLSSKMILQIHDELILECPEDEAERASLILKEEMEGAAKLSVPLTVETGTGKNWFEVK